MVTDEEWRTRPSSMRPRFAGYDACLCFEGGQLDNDGHEGVVVRRKAAGTLRVLATGRASHSGSAPDHGLNALLALARTATAIASLHDPHGPEQLSVVPTVMRSGDAFNVVPAAGELIFDLRAQRPGGLRRRDGRGERRARRRRPGGADGAQVARDGLRRGHRRTSSPARRGASAAPSPACPRGGASDASHFADTIALTVDGLGPRGGGAHTPGEFVLEPAMRERLEVALALAHEVLES